MSASIGDRRSVSYNLPYLAVGGPGATAGGGMGRTGTMGEGSLSLDDMAGANGGVTLLVQAPELMGHDGEGGGHDSFRTPPADLISRPLELGPSAPLPNKLSAVRPRAATTSEGSSSARPSGLSALAGINSSSLPSFSDALAAPTPFPGPLPGIGSRPVSRSGSINSQQAPENLVPHPPTTASASSSRKGTLVGPESQTPGRSSSKAPRSASGSVASAMLLSGMSLVSSSGSSRQGAVLGRSSTAPIAGRDSLDDSDGVSSFSERGLMSMESLGEFDDGVSQMGTGYAVASSKRNAEFHAIFKSITDDDYLIEDYGCALQREILIQGRLYISEHHLSFNANIFGWVTTVTLPFAEIVSIEKRMTAYVIPNAIQVTTLHSRYIIASFLSRDTTYDLLVNIWRMVHPAVPISVAQPDSSSQPMDDDGGSLDSFDENDAGRSANIGSIRGRSGTRAMRRVGEGGRKGDPRRPSITSPRGSSANLKLHPVTVDTCPTLKHLTHVCMDTVFPSAPEKIYNLMFTSGFMREFFINDQRLMDLQISDWAPETSGSNLLARTMSFIKPLSAPIGPKQTKCLLRDENAHVDFDNYVCVITTTRTPDVPSGSAFAVKTRTSMTWAKNNSCRVVVLTGVEWTKSSFLKGIIERSCLEGQKTHHVDLEKAMRSYIHQHRSEFLEEGQEVDNTSSIDTSSLDDEDAVGTGEGFTEMVSVASDDRRAFGAVQAALPFLQPVFATMSGVGDLLGGVSIVNTSVAFFVVVLVLSNLWTLSRRPTSVDPRSYDPSQQPSNRRTPDEVANAVRDVLHDYFTLQSPPTTPSLSSDMIPTSPAQEAADIGAVLDTLEARIAELRRGLASLD